MNAAQYDKYQTVRWGPVIGFALVLSVLAVMLVGLFTLANAAAGG